MKIQIICGLLGFIVGGITFYAPAKIKEEKKVYQAILVENDRPQPFVVLNK